MITANRRNITNVYRIKRIKPTNTSYAGQTHNGQTHAQKFKSRNRADAIAKTYQINYEKNPARNLLPHVKKDEWRPTFSDFSECDEWTDGSKKSSHNVSSVHRAPLPLPLYMHLRLICCVKESSTADRTVQYSTSTVLYSYKQGGGGTVRILFVTMGI